jgi:ribonuclease BN (tRNA processing enzyme)
MKLIFLGSGGSRAMMASQQRKTGGMFFDFDKVKFVLDPGPGSIVNALSIGLQPEKFSGVVLSHFHPDHSTDANVYLDAIEEPFIIAEQHCLLDKKQTKATFDYYPCITPYHQKKSKVYAVKQGDAVDVSGVKFTAVKTNHYDPTVGYRIKHGDIDIGFVADGDYYRGLEKHYDGCKLLLANVVIPKGKDVESHKYLSVDGLISLLNALSVKPKLVVLSHLSMWMVRSNLWKQEKILQEATNLKVIHAEDFMSIDLKTLSVSTAKNGKERLVL